MKYEKVKNRTRIIKMGKKDWYETESGAKFPIKSKPMIFMDMQTEFNEYLIQIQEQEKNRKTVKNDKDFDVETYTNIVNEWLEIFYNTVEKVSKFNGYEIDIEFIKSNMSAEDPYWYINSVSQGRAIYSIDDLIEKKKKK